MKRVRNPPRGGIIFTIIKTERTSRTMQGKFHTCDFWALWSSKCTLEMIMQEIRTQVLDKINQRALLFLVEGWVVVRRCNPLKLGRWDRVVPPRQFLYYQNRNETVCMEPRDESLFWIKRTCLWHSSLIDFLPSSFPLSPCLLSPSVEVVLPWCWRRRPGLWTISAADRWVVKQRKLDSRISSMLRFLCVGWRNILWRTEMRGLWLSVFTQYLFQSMARRSLSKLDLKISTSSW